MIYLKRVLLRGLLGIPIGVFFGTTITLIWMGISGKTDDVFGILICRYITSCLVGFAFSAISIVFTFKNWSRLKQLLVYYTVMLILSLLTYVISSVVLFSYITKGSEIYSIAPPLYLEPLSIVLLALTFTSIFMICWLGYYLYWRHKVKMINILIHKK